MLKRMLGFVAGACSMWAIVGAGCNGTVPFPTAEEASTRGSDPTFPANPSTWSCEVAQPFPYPDGIPYVAIHAGPGHSDYVPCMTAPAFEQSWHVLKGHGLVQPNTFSPDGAVTYAATTNPEPDSCTIHAIATEDGRTLWCRSYPDVLESAVEVDLDGMLYFSSANRWSP